MTQKSVSTLVAEAVAAGYQAGMMASHQYASDRDKFSAKLVMEEAENSVYARLRERDEALEQLVKAS